MSSEMSPLIAGEQVVVDAVRKGANWFCLSILRTSSVCFSIQTTSRVTGLVATKMVFELSDGSGAIVEAANIGKPEVFIEVYERLSS